MQKRSGIMAFAAGIGLLAASALADDTVPGEKLYKKVCRSCHGPTAKGMASFPKLIGHDVGYLVGRLQQYRSGEKVGPNTALMAPRVADLSDQDITDVATYIVEAFN